MMNERTTKRFLFLIFCVYFVHNIAFLSSIPPLVQNVANSMSNSPFIVSLQDQIINIPIESKLNIMYTTYNLRQLYYGIAFSQSQSILLRISEKMGLNEWNRIDYFNTLVFVTALCALLKNMKNQQNIDKMKKKGIVNKQIHSTQLLFLLIYTMLFRDVDDVF